MKLSIKIVDLYKALSSKQEYVMSKQLLRSGTAIGALIWEAEHAESKKDFVHKLSVALKEANETNYWLELLYRAEIISKTNFSYLCHCVTELIKLLCSIIKTTKTRYL